MQDLSEQMILLEWLHMMFQDLRHNLNDKLHKLDENLVFYVTFKSHEDVSQKRKVKLSS